MCFILSTPSLTTGSQQKCSGEGDKLCYTSPLDVSCFRHDISKAMTSSDFLREECLHLGENIAEANTRSHTSIQVKLSRDRAVQF